MAYERMEHIVPGRRRVAPPAVTIYPRGTVYLNAEAYRALGRPRYVAVYRAGTELAFHARSSAAGAFRVSAVGQGGALFTSTALGRLVGGRAKLPAEVRDSVVRARLSDGLAESTDMD